MAVQPNPELANALRMANVPANWKNSAELFAYMLNVADNGVPDSEGLAHIDRLLQKLVAAQLETTVILASKVDHQL